MPFGIACKQGVPVALSRPLGAYIQHAHQLDPAEYAVPLRRLDELRAAVLSPTAAADSPPKLMEYYAQLQRLSQRFPVGGAAEGNVKISFVWQDFAGKKRRSGKPGRLRGNRA